MTTASHKGIYIADLAPGVPLTPSVFVVKGVRILPPDSSRPRVELTLSDRTGECKAKIWRPSDAQIAWLNGGNRLHSLFTVRGTTTDDPKWGRQILLDACEPLVDVPLDLTPFLAPPSAGLKDDWAQFTEIGRAIGNSHLRLLLRELFPAAVQEQFRACPAAQSVHHAHPGGLLRHTVEVALLCYDVCDLYPYLKRDLLVVGALVHDYGKLFGYESALAGGGYTDSEILIGHVCEGAFRVRAAAERINDFPPGLSMELHHLVLSHHGLPEHGAAKPPMFGEAWALHLCDHLSAVLTQYEAETGRMRATGQKHVRKYDRDIFAGDLGLDALDLAGVDSQSAAARKMLTDPFSEPILPPPAPATGTVRLPLLGWVAAGGGAQGSATAAETAEWRDVILPPGGADFLLRVVGDSMIGAGILPRDILLIRRTDDAPRPGDIVIAALADGSEGGVVKRFALSATGAPVLVSENEAYPPIPVTGETRFQGRVTCLLREFG